MFASNTSQVSNDTLYIEDVFSTWLYTGTDSGGGDSQTLPIGIDMSGKGGLAWFKSRNNGYITTHHLLDTARGGSSILNSNNTNAAYTNAGTVTFGASSQTVGPLINNIADNQVGWFFRKAPKFFDVVTYTGDGTSNRQIAHSLGSVPGFIIVKSTSATWDWRCYHRSLGATKYIDLNLTAAAGTASTVWNDTEPTATHFTVGSAGSQNQSGATYVAYLFAHDTATDGVIQCGSYVGNGSTTQGPIVTLGWEPQWLLVRRSSLAEDWFLVDNMRGWNADGMGGFVKPNNSGAEGVVNGSYWALTPTGFQVLNTNNGAANTSGETYIYIAIRRGPMRTPTSGTSVFAPVTYTGDGAADRSITGVGFPPDLLFMRERNRARSMDWWDRLRGQSKYLSSDLTAAEQTPSTTVEGTLLQDGFKVSGNDLHNSSTQPQIAYLGRRAPGFFDVVCYTGTGSSLSQPHNLGVEPELMIVKSRNNTYVWYVYFKTAGSNNSIYLDGTQTAFNGISAGAWTSTPTATNINIGTNFRVNGSGTNYVAYLFASCPGVSKVGSYTGNGSSQTINMGFAAGARFFLVKRTDSTGDWWVYDSARGITAPADPALRLNSTAAEVTSADAVDPASSGIVVNQETTCNINVNGATYIYLGIA